MTMCEKCNKAESAGVVYLYEKEICVGAERLCETCLDNALPSTD